MKNSILNDRLKEFDYYVDKLPMYLKSSYGFIEHFRVWYDLLVGRAQPDLYYGIIPASDTILALLNIFDSDYMQTLINLPDADVQNGISTNNDMIDKLAALFGVKRTFSVSYRSNETLVTKVLNLTDYELLILIKCQIVQSYCDGTYLQISQFYKDCGLSIICLTSTTPATCNLILQRAADSSIAYSENIADMFLAGLLRIESMGIEYYQSILDLTSLLFWDSISTWSDEDATIEDNEGEWSI